MNTDSTGVGYYLIEIVDTFCVLFGNIFHNCYIFLSVNCFFIF